MLKAIIFVCIHDAPGGFIVSRQTKGKADVLFAWVELHQCTFHHPKNLCSCNTDGSWRENVSTTR
jgi:hypothetical protein